MKVRSTGKILIALIALGLVIAFFALGWQKHLSFASLKSEHQWLVERFHQQPLAVGAVFFAAYVAVTALSLPGAAIMTMAAGAVFGFWIGLVLVSFASSIGASVAFLFARYVLRDTVSRRFADRLATIDAGLKRDGVYYLLTVRLIAFIPFFVVNLAFGLTSVRLVTFYLVSQIGMLAGTAVYVNAGTRLAQIESPSQVLSPPVILSFVALAVFPWIAKGFVAWFRRRHALGRHRPPARFDYDLAVIGAGSGGLVAANLAATMRAKVVLVEKAKMGGECLNTGCVPSKALIRIAKVLSDLRRAEEWGLTAQVGAVDFAAVMERVQRSIAEVAPHDSRARYQALGVDCLVGAARIVDPWTIRVGERSISARSIVVATGADPALPDIPGIGGIDALTSETVWGLRELPRRLAVVGGGPIGCELAQCFARLGSVVTVIHSGTHLLSREDPDVAAVLESALSADGVQLLMGRRVVSFARSGAEITITCSGAGTERVVADRVLVALGRSPRVRGFGLEDLNVRLTDKGAIDVDEFLQSSIPTIYACGDVTGRFQFTHAAAHQAWHAAVNGLMAPVKRLRINERVMPWTTFTDPEVARVGLCEEEAKQRSIPHEITTFDLADLDRAIVERERRGLVKVLTRPGKDRILGACIVGPRAGELIAELTLAMQHGVGLKKILATIHTYPTLSEANQRVAGAWRKAHTSPRMLAMLERFLRLRRSRARSRLAALMVAITLVVLLALVACVYRAMTRSGTAPDDAHHQAGRTDHCCSDAVCALDSSPVPINTEESVHELLPRR